MDIIQNNDLYASQKKVYPDHVQGRFRSLKNKINTLLLGIYFITPWIRWERSGDAPDQAILLDLSHQRSYFFDLNIWAQDTSVLALGVILFTIVLFFMTSLFGRIWCGFTCVQTVFIELFVWVEKLCEGPRNQRIKLDRSALSFKKLGKKILKNSLWLLISILTSFTWIAYFNETFVTLHEIVSGKSSVVLYSMLALFSASTFLFAGYAREQFCIYACPWPRIQASLYDADTLVVSYQKWRGEPRGKKKISLEKNVNASVEKGHCIDCMRCVNVCPMGIDIRAGSQLECIGCALCIDACNEVMKKINFPENLITYDSLKNLNNAEKNQPLKKKFLRMNTFFYGMAIVAIGSLGIFLLINISPFELTVQQKRNPLFTLLSDNSIQNSYIVTILNKDLMEKTLSLEIQGMEGKIEILHIGNFLTHASIPVVVPSNAVKKIHIFIKSNPNNQDKEKSKKILFSLMDPMTQVYTHYETIFIRP